MFQFVNEDEIYKLLERLKKERAISVYVMNGDEIYFAEKLVELGLASKSSSSHNTYYYYGVDETLTAQCRFTINGEIYGKR
jgi:hypothetical protein